jgi:AraC-like DNA-binding protein/tetratricopeptide (TPR) repeat protein/TolB-like protein
MEPQQSMQEQYLAVIKKVIEDNIDNVSFSVADLAREAGLSRSMLHRKLISLTGKSATDLITEIRLKKAFELLENDAGTVSEIAYSVGYSSPSYFNKVFRKTYKVSPGDVRRKGRGNIPHLRVVSENGVPVSAGSTRSGFKAIVTLKIFMIITVTFGVLAMIMSMMDRFSSNFILPEWTVYLILILLAAGITIGGMSMTGQAGMAEPVDILRSSNLSKIATYSSVVVFIAVGILLYPRVFGKSGLNTLTSPVTVVNEFGEPVTRRVVKEEYITKLALFPFANEINDSTLDWMRFGIMEAIVEDCYQFSNILVEWFVSTHLNEQITRTKDIDYPYFLTGVYSFTEGVYTITSRLYQSSNGALIAEQTFMGADFFILIDSICAQARMDLGIPEAILNSTPDITVSELLTNNLDAFSYYVKGKFGLQPNIGTLASFNKAIQLDSTYAAALLVMAYWNYNFMISHESAVKYIDQCMRHRGRMSENVEYLARLYYYLIHGDTQKAIALAEMKYELNPHDFNELPHLKSLYNKLMKFDKAEGISHQMNELVPGHPPYQLSLANSYLRSGKTAKSMEVVNEMLAANPAHVEAHLRMGEIYLHQDKLQLAEEAFNKAILLMPENEQYWEKLLDHIVYLRQKENIMGPSESIVGLYQSEVNELLTRLFISEGKLSMKMSNQSSYFVYPVSDTVFVCALKDGGDGADVFVVSTFFRNNQGKVYKFLFEQWNDNTQVSHFQFWKEDSLVIKAKDLLESGQASDALAAFRQSYKAYPEHYYLANYIKHLELMQSPEYGSIKSAFIDLAGEYLDLKLYTENGRLYYTNDRGLIYRLLPLGKDRFMVPSKYVLQIHAIRESGVVTGINLIYRDGNEDFHPRIFVKELASHSY